MASLTIYISRIVHQTESISVEAHYTTDTGIGGTRSVDVPMDAAGIQMEDAIIAEVKRHCLEKWGLFYQTGVDRVILCSRIDVRP